MRVPAYLEETNIFFAIYTLNQFIRPFRICTLSLRHFFQYLLAVLFKDRIRNWFRSFYCSVAIAVRSRDWSTLTMLRIHEILVRIQIRWSIPLTNGYPVRFQNRIRMQIRILLFSSVAFNTSTKNFLPITCWRYIYLHHFSKMKSHKEITKQ